MTFSPGDRVRADRRDPEHHHRVPRYVRGATGTVVEQIGVHPLPYDHSRTEPVYTVRFEAAELFGTGDHSVTVDVWHSHLESL
jgi:nitrile hydratase